MNSEIITSTAPKQEPGALFDFRRGLVTVYGEKTPEAARTAAEITAKWIKDNRGWTFYIKDLQHYTEAMDCFIFKIERGLILHSSSVVPLLGS